MLVGVLVGVAVGVIVGVAVGVAVGVLVGVTVGVGVKVGHRPVFEVIVPPAAEHEASKFVMHVSSEQNEYVGIGPQTCAEPSLTAAKIRRKRVTTPFKRDKRQSSLELL